ncbi:unnamed protein product [Sphenostylis stenocarpa]|uniref:TF-B3 domain-containing protein n=1 Tax=Sphenostylis stenocarpa TaxID=92480 RepID=A0AA86W3I8_9FABA|nr:unnamed protein product [Sphenostylis stenocarpa]
MFSYDGTGIHFVKGIEEHNLCSGELFMQKLPPGFVIKYWVDIANPLLLLLPEGAKWKRNWTRIGVDVWLVDTWKNFAEFYSLDVDNYLLFKYLGKSQFEVVIFNHSGVEIEYPLMETTLDAEENDDSLPVSPFTKKLKTSTKEEPGSYYSSQHVETECVQSQRIKVESKEFHADDSDDEKPKIRDSKDGTIKSENLLEDTKISISLARARAQAFRSENPLYPSYIQRNIMVMPASIISEEEQQKEENSVTLRISEERAWHVQFYRNYSSGQIKLTSGWMNFVQDNNLKVGNVCVFEKVNEKPGISFRVHIYCDKEESSPSKFPVPNERLKDTPIS